MSITSILNRSVLSRSVFATLCICCLATVPVGSPYANAQERARIDTSRLTKDLDTKNDALAEEEAKLLAAIDDGKKSAIKSAIKGKTDESGSRASIDLKKVADSIANSDAPEGKKVEMVKPATLPVQTKPVPAPATVKVLRPLPAAAAQPAAAKENRPAPEQIQKAAAPAVPEQKIVREVIKETDPQLRREVTSMGNLFTQWQTEFEKKHAKTLEMQQKQQDAVTMLGERMDSIERRGSGEEEQKRLILTEENRLLREEKQALEDAQKQIETRLVALEKTESAVAQPRTDEFGEQIKGLVKASSQMQETLGKQAETLDSLKLADGQLRHRMTDSEEQVSDAVREINGVKLSVNRIETNLAELSEQFVESLKYRPHAVYDASTEWSEHPYDWSVPGPQYSRLPHNAVMSDMPLVTVIETNANLWSGPGEDDKIITTIRRGGQLALEAIDQDWYRVILADGRRAWIPARSVIHNNPVGKDTTLRIASAD